VDYGASKHMTCDRNIFSVFQEQEGGFHVELGDDATYLVKGLGSYLCRCLKVMFLS
jgi:hypothetical protein